jgi:hypothetical protein
MADTDQSPTGNNREPLAFDERTRRLMELRKQVRAGTYRPAPEAVATGLLREWSALSTVSREPVPVPVDANPDTSSFAGRFMVSAPAQEPASPAMMTA